MKLNTFNEEIPHLPTSQVARSFIDHNKNPQVHQPTQVGNLTQVEIQDRRKIVSLPKDPEPIDIDADELGLPPEPHLHARRVTEQDSSVALETRAVEGLEKGYTRIPNPVLMMLVTGNFTRNEIKVALIIARFTISFRRDFAPLSKKVLERQTGLRGAAILEAVAGLVKKGLVQKQQGNQYRPNMLGLVLPEAWDGPDKPTKKQFNSQVFPPQESPFEKVQKSTHPVVENVNYPQVGRMTQGEVSNPTPFKDIKIYKNNNSLSSLPKSLEDYFQNLKPIKKRESERKAFEELIQDYQASEIVDCLALLKKRGVKIGQMGEFQVCHSPMAYLSKAMNEVLEEVSRSRTVKSLNETRLAREAQQKTEEEELKKLETQQWQAKTQAFERAYPSLEKQQEIINQFCRNKFNPTQVPGRIYAISEWWRTIDVQNAQVATC